MSILNTILHPINAIILAILAALGFGSICGCNLFNQHAQLMDTMRGAITEASQRLGDSSVAQYAGGGMLINPGIRVEAGLTYYASARYEGLSAQIQASAAGKMDRGLTDYERQTIDSIYHNTALSAAEKWKIIAEMLARVSARAASTQPASGG